MFKKLTLSILVMLPLAAFAQNVGIGTNTPNASAKLDITDPNRGVLIPRVALTATNLAGPVTAPATSLIVYNTATAGIAPNNVTPGFYYWNGAAWVRFLNSQTNDWSLTGNTGTNAAVNFIGTPDAVDFVTRTNNTERIRVTAAGNVGVGTNAPNSPFTVRTANAAANARTTSLSNAIGDVMFELATAKGSTTNLPGDVTTQIGQAYNGGLITEGFRFHRGIAAADGAISVLTSGTERIRVTSAGNVGIGTNAPAYRLDLASGTFGFGNANVRTETRDNAGLQVGAQSGFFETVNPTNYPAGATSWWHLIDARHSNTANNYALQIAGSFFDQELWFRKTNNNGAQAWSRLLTTNSGWTTLGNAGTVAATNFIGTTDAIDFVTRTNNIERTRVSTAGNFGIGTNAPAARLDVNGGAWLRSTGTTAADHVYVMSNPSVAASGGLIHTQIPANTAGTWGFKQYTTGTGTSIPQSRMTIGLVDMSTPNTILTPDILSLTGNGNVGVGIVAPVARLQVVQNGVLANTEPQLRISNNTNAVGSASGIRFNVNGWDVKLQTVQNVDWLQLTDAGGGVSHSWLGGRYYPGSTSNNAVNTGYITGNGTNLGIGTTVLTHRLNVEGTVFAAGELRAFNNNTVFRRANTPFQFTDLFDPNFPSAGVHLANNESEEGGFFANGNYAMVYSPGDNDLVKFVDEDGFDNAGNAYDGTALRGRIDGGGQYFQVSDANSKENITRISSGLNKVLALSGYTYDFKLLAGEIEKNSPKLRGAGILAQEAEKVLPEAVSNSNGHYMVNYAAFVPLFIEAFKEQQKQIEAVKAENEALKSQMLEIEAMRKDIEALKKMIEEKK